MPVQVLRLRRLRGVPRDRRAPGRVRLRALPLRGARVPLHHLAVDHAWPLDTLPAYGKALPLRVPVPAPTSSEPQPQQHHHRLLAVEGDERSLFALSVRPCGAGVASCAVVSCVRTSAAAEVGPRFTYMLWARSPAAVPAGMPPGIAGRRLMMETDVASCAEPGRATVEDGMALYVPPPMLSG